jgi:hypothetical protein
MRFATLLLFAGLLSIPRACFAQEKETWIAGLGFGQAFGVNEDPSRPLVLVGRMEAVAFNSIVPGVSPEFGISLFTLRSKTTTTPQSYRTQIIAPDLRFRFSPLTTPVWFPYLYGGAGMAIYDVLEVPPAASPAASLSDATPFFTAGAGVSHQIMEHVGVDLNIGAAVSLSDDINPIRDGKPDGWWSGILSIYWIF